MPKKCFFTVNLLIKSDSNIKSAVDSVICDEKFFIENIQLILIDSVGTELSTQICAEYTEKYPENIYFVDAVGQNTAKSYNYAASLAFGTYVSYIDNYGKYSENVFRSAVNILKSAKIPVLCCMPMYSTPGEPDRRYTDDTENGIISIHDTPDRFILMLGCYFFKNTVVQNITFDKKLLFNYDTKFITDVLMKTSSYVFTDSFSYTLSSPTVRDPMRYEPKYSPEFYSENIKEFIIPMLKSYPGSSFIMSVMMYLIYVKLALNADDNYSGIPAAGKVSEFLDSCANALKYIDDTIILNKAFCRRCGLDDELPFRLLRMKYKNVMLRPAIDLVMPKAKETHKYYAAPNRIEEVELSGEFAAHIKNVLIMRSREITAVISAINHDSEGVYIDAYLHSCSCLDENDYSIYVSINDKRTPVIKSEVYSLKKFFSRSFLKRSTFRFFIPLGSGKQMNTAALYFRYGRLAFRMNISFSGLYSKLSDEIENSYAVINKRILSYDKKSKSLVLRRATESYIAVSERRFLSEIGKKRGMSKRLTYKRIRSLARSVIQEKQNKKILIFYDDRGINFNGNLLFRYFYKNRNNDFEPYICVEHDSPQKNFLIDAGYGNILDIGSQKQKATVLAADYLYAVDCDPYEYLSFNHDDMIYLRDMINAKTISVKNFFLTYQSAHYDNRLRDNTHIVFCTSKTEKQNLLAPVYDYDESMIHITGSPLLGAATDKSGKLILIAPEERRRFSVYENSNYYKFSESIFFNEYNDLISDIGLLSECKKNGWKIALLLPPLLSKYYKMFNSDDIVHICPYTEHDEYSLLSEAAVLITDHSELQFRFAYLGKSVVYYFPPGLPADTERIGEKLSENGFGDMISGKADLIEYLKNGMSDGFRLTEKYSRRRKEFFGVFDGKNSKRIFDESIKLIFNREV